MALNIVEEVHFAFVRMPGLTGRRTRTSSGELLRAPRNAETSSNKKARLEKDEDPELLEALTMAQCSVEVSSNVDLSCEKEIHSIFCKVTKKSF